MKHIVTKLSDESILYKVEGIYWFTRSWDGAGALKVVILHDGAATLVRPSS